MRGNIKIASKRLCCVLTIAIQAVMQCDLTAQTEDAIDAILLSNEFKSEEGAQLHALPSSSVVELTKRLNAVTVDDPKAGRLFEFLVVKIKQFEFELPNDVREAAITALKRKVDSRHGASTDYRKSLLMMLNQGTVAADTKVKSSMPMTVTSAPAAQVPTAAVSPQPATPVAHIPAASAGQRMLVWPWVFGTLVVIAALILKRRA